MDILNEQPVYAEDESLIDHFTTAISFTANEDDDDDNDDDGIASNNAAAGVNGCDDNNSNNMTAPPRPLVVDGGDDDHDDIVGVVRSPAEYCSWPPSVANDPTYTPVAGSVAASGRSPGSYMRAAQAKRLVCSTPLVHPEMLPFGCGRHLLPAVQSETPKKPALSHTLAADREFRYLDRVYLAACRDESFHLSRVRTDKMNAVQRKNYRTLCRQAYGPTPEEQAEADRMIHERYGHLHKPVQGRKYGMRL